MEPRTTQRPVITMRRIGSCGLARRSSSSDIAARRFAFKHRHDAALKQTLELGHGDLLLMGGDTQRHYKHALPRTVKPVGERINLTFRQIAVRVSQR